LHCQREGFNRREEAKEKKKKGGWMEMKQVKKVLLRSHSAKPSRFLARR
jgi:hypothetical protein